MVDTAAIASSLDSVVNQRYTQGLPSRITQALQTAASRTGVDFSYLLKKASQESGLDPNAKSNASSATGLFQFTGQTWLQMVKQHGAAYGLSDYADHIQVDSNGTAHVSDPSWKKAILNLRKDPQVSAEMAGELDKTNLTSLQDNVGGTINSTDLYMAHFLGAGGASSFLNAMKSNPNASAASVVPDAASANPKVFYNADGTPRSLSQIYRHFAQKFDSTSATTLVASASPTTTSTMPATTTIASSSTTAATTGTTQSAGLHYTQVASSDTATAIASTLLSANGAGSYVPPVSNSLRVHPSSLVSTMVLAQMNLGDMGGLTSSALDTTATINHDKKNALDALSGVGIG